MAECLRNHDLCWKLQRKKKKKKAAFFLPEGCDLPGQECRGGATSAKTHSSLGDTMKNVVAHGKRVTGMGGLEITRAPPPRRKRRQLAGVCLLWGGGVEQRGGVNGLFFPQEVSSSDSPLPPLHGRAD